MKAHPLMPTLLAGLVTAAALSLFVRTAVSRAQQAEAFRLAAKAPHRESPAHPEDTGGMGRAQPLPAPGPERHAAIGKRIRTALSISHSLERTRALLDLLKELDGEDFRVALDVYNECLPGNRGDEFKMLAHEWGRRDPEAALDYSADDFSLKLEIFDKWSRSEGETALQWAKELAPSRDREHFLGLAISALATRDPRLALDQFEGLDESTISRALSSMLYHSGGEATAEVLEWIDGLEDPARRISAVQNLFNSWRMERAQEKFDVLMRNPAALEGEGMSLDKAFGDWILADPSAARAALEQLPEGPQRHGAIQQSILKLFADGHVENAMEMVAAYPAEGDDRLFQNCVSALAGSDSQRALEHAHLIKDPFTHNQAYSGILGRWIRESPAEVEQWLDNKDVPREVVDYMKAHGYREEVEWMAKRTKTVR